MPFDIDFFKGFWEYVANLQWWQGGIIIFMVIFSFMVGKFWRNVLTWIGERLSKNNDDTLQYRMFWGLTNDVLNILIRDEIRRSFKENGFDILSGSEFAQYVKNKNKTIMSILKNHIINLYPPNRKDVKVSMESVLEYIDKKESAIEDIIFEIYIEAKRIKLQDIKDTEEIDKNFEQEIENYIKKKEGNDCKSCLVVMLGKRIIAENKKSKIKTLKTQMTFAEQKISSIHSDFLSFYAEKLNGKI